MLRDGGKGGSYGLSASSGLFGGGFGVSSQLRFTECLWGLPASSGMLRGLGGASDASRCSVGL